MAFFKLLTQQQLPAFSILNVDARIEQPLPGINGLVRRNSNRVFQLNHVSGGWEFVVRPRINDAIRIFRVVLAGGAVRK